MDVQPQREAWFRHGRSTGDQRVQLLPAGGLPLAFPLDQPEALGCQQQARRVA